MKRQQTDLTSDFGDQRLSARHAWLSNLVALAPDASFPRMVDSVGELEAVYRFLGNERVTYERLMEPHFQATAEAVIDDQHAIVIHDRTEFRFGGETRREGLGRVGTKTRGQGFYGQFALAVSGDGRRRPLGLLGFTPFFLMGPPRERVAAYDFTNPERKSKHWGELIKQAEQRLAGKVKPINVMDREADDYELFEQLVKSGSRFVFRLRYDRYVSQEHNPRPSHLRTVMEGVESQLVREVPLSRRGGHRSARNRKIHPPRDTRMASLHVRAKRVSVLRPSIRRTTCTLPALTLNAVQVYEPAPPNGEAPIEWLLLTSEPIDTPEQVATIIDIYRTRWLIEEYFKALKTGCAYEQRQLESRHTLLNALGVLAPVAVDLLRIRSVARDSPEAPAREVSTPTQIQVLRVFSKRHPLPSKPTARDVLLAIAGLGGHLKNNGDPGWLVLHRGYQKLLALEAGWSAREQAGRM